jgi:hypothetical protein
MTGLQSLFNPNSGERSIIMKTTMRLNSILIVASLLIFSLGSVYADGYEKYRNCVVMAEQSQNQIAIVHVKTGKIIWNWKASESTVPPERYAWFYNPSDAKVVYNGNYVLMCASGGACALIRLKDKKIMFYAKAGKNPHSIELLPDGNIVCAASTGNCLTIFKTDTVHFPDSVVQRSFFCNSAHNVVWDQKRALLWTADLNKIRSFSYNFSKDTSTLQPVDSLKFEDESGHDLFPVPGKDALFFTSQNKNWTFDIREKKLKEIKSKYQSIKSISAESKGQTPIISIPKEQWWTDEILDLNGKSILRIPGLKIYKARWIVENTFSYPEHDSFRICH